MAFWADPINLKVPYKCVGRLFTVTYCGHYYDQGPVILGTLRESWF